MNHPSQPQFGGAAPRAARLLPLQEHEEPNRETQQQNSRTDDRAPRRLHLTKLTSKCRNAEEMPKTRLSRPAISTNHRPHIGVACASSRDTTCEVQKFSQRRSKRCASSRSPWRQWPRAPPATTHPQQRRPRRSNLPFAVRAFCTRKRWHWATHWLPNTWTISSLLLTR